MKTCVVLLSVLAASVALPPPEGQEIPLMKVHPMNQLFSDAIIPPPPEGKLELPGPREEFKYKWLAYGGECFDEQILPNMVEVAGTQLLQDDYHQYGCEVVGLMTRNMPEASFNEFAEKGTVGLFTWTDKTTIFPEYAHLRDRPECAGTCAGACSNTCTGDGRKYDSLAGLGGVRGTCLDDNFMCTEADPYRHGFSVLVHEVAHTIHQYGLPGTTNLWQEIYDAFLNARANAIWDLGSYAMSNHLEFWAEATGTYLHTDRHPTASGGMNGCGRPSGQFCETEEEARAWLAQQDPLTYDCLKHAWTNFDDTLPGEMSICPP